MVAVVFVSLLVHHHGFIVIEALSLEVVPLVAVVLIVVWPYWQSFIFCGLCAEWQIQIFCTKPF